MSGTTLILTERRQFDDEVLSAAVLRNAIAAWLAKELSQ